jgi:hypothetical protein
MCVRGVRPSVRVIQLYHQAHIERDHLYSVRRRAAPYNQVVALAPNEGLGAMAMPAQMQAASAYTSRPSADGRGCARPCHASRTRPVVQDQRLGVCGGVVEQATKVERAALKDRAQAHVQRYM